MAAQHSSEEEISLEVPGSTKPGKTWYEIIGTLNTPPLIALHGGPETLLLNGQYDEPADLCVEPWFNSIAKVRWATLENAAHMSHWEARERFMQLCGYCLTGGSSR
ncbi:uncharacterized protein F4817DRAFT_316820 [Daldinia loculata]|uniref:uncharacterized protein n=1 Tax=Daldinia loculata TaxID=103429 RepID=UPI0020C1DF6C|nr:uncharacterized protein F4817DRAFT_316820 [Daldinia loculata]KAI1646322.1 hypothetical protein F4817DRAFT_316820 [Daldinia loculata]